MGQLRLPTLLLAELGHQRPIVIAKGQSCGQVVHRRLFVDLHILFVNVVKVAGAGLGDIMKQTELQYPADIGLVIETRQGKTDDGRTVGMLSHRLGSRAQKLETAAGRALEHTDFEKEIGQTLHAFSLYLISRRNDGCATAPALTGRRQLSMLCEPNLIQAYICRGGRLKA